MVRGLDKRLVPITGLGVEVCEYDSSGGEQLARSASSTTASLVANLEQGTNDLRVAPAYANAIGCSPTSPPEFFVTFAGATRTVNVEDTGTCGFVTNGVLIASGTEAWRALLSRFLDAITPVDPRESDSPVAGVCLHATGTVGTVALRSLDYVPQPRCLIIRHDQRLRVENGLPTTITARLGSHLTATLSPGQGVMFPKPISDYLAPGVHTLVFTPASGASIWVDAICDPAGSNCSSPRQR